ncbi:hypothetical protein KRP22_010118 [Phytophthora ramorum]|nr:tRNA-splicing endonuclease subunit Sen2 [Phytophthora ramorum]
MVAWKVLQSGEVAVTFDADEIQAWRHFQKETYGVAAMGKLQLSVGMGGNGSEAAANSGRDGVETKRRRHLSLPEAYYAAAVDGVLPVDGPLKDVWEQFESSSVTFTRHFAIYQHFRRLGWTPMSGLNYGAHYVLYRGSAAEFHSEYVVYVQSSEDASSWNTIQSLTRIAADVKKTVLLCTVTTAQADAAVDSSVVVRPDTDLTFGVYRFHDVQFTVEAIAIRFWDASTCDVPESYAFQPQAILPKKAKAAKRKNNTKRPKRELDNENLKGPGNST